MTAHSTWPVLFCSNQSHWRVRADLSSFFLLFLSLASLLPLSFEPNASQLLLYEPPPAATKSNNISSGTRQLHLMSWGPSKVICLTSCFRCTYFPHSYTRSTKWPHLTTNDWPAKSGLWWKWKARLVLSKWLGKWVSTTTGLQSKCSTLRAGWGAMLSVECTVFSVHSTHIVLSASVERQIRYMKVSQALVKIILVNFPRLCNPLFFFISLSSFHEYFYALIN